MQVPILKGIYANQQADFRVSYPINREPEIVTQGISRGYLRCAPGITQLGDGAGPGADRGGTVWEGQHFRVMGGAFMEVSAAGAMTQRGTVASGGPVRFAAGFGRLGIGAGGRLYYWDGSTLTQVTDPDLGTVVDVVWVDGYWMTTDGEYLVVTELNDPTQVDPLKYGSSEADPDPVLGLIKVHNEVYACNRHTIECFQNRGGSGFPFVRNPGAMIQKGIVGTHAKASFIQTFAFVGGAQDEEISVYLAGGGEAVSISTPEIDRQLNAVPADRQAEIRLEARKSHDEDRLYIHLPGDRTLVYYHRASQRNKEPVWSILASGSAAEKPWPLRHLTLVDGRWVGGTPDGRLGYLDEGVETQFGEISAWQFDTGLLYNEGRGAVVRSIELVGLPGRAPFGDQPTVFMSYSLDGETWSQERPVSMGRAGQRSKRVQWRPMFRMSNVAGLRFRGVNTGAASWARLEADVEGLAV